MTFDEEQAREIARLEQWISDLQSGSYVNCVYCGHRYGPDPGTPVAMADVLKDHIEICPKHPASRLKADNILLRLLLFQDHPCPMKYGDDGELQCNSCRIDFKRDPVEEIQVRLFARRLLSA